MESTIIKLSVCAYNCIHTVHVYTYIYIWFLVSWYLHLSWVHYRKWNTTICKNITHYCFVCVQKLQYGNTIDTKVCKWAHQIYSENSHSITHEALTPSFIKFNFIFIWLYIVANYLNKKLLPGWQLSRLS